MIALLQKHTAEIKYIFSGGEPLEVNPGKRIAVLLEDDQGQAAARGGPGRINTGARGP